MGFDLRYPNITAQDEKGQLTQMRSYLHQLVEQLQWAFNSMDTTAVYSSVQKSGKASGAVGTVGDAEREATFNAIKSLIIKSADIVEAYYETINKKLSGLYVAQSDFGTFKEATEATLSATSTGINQAYTNIQTVSTNLTNKISTTETNLTNKITTTETTLTDKLGNTETAFTAKIGEVESHVGEVAGKVTTVEGGLNEVSGKVKEVDSALTGVSSVVEGVTNTAAAAANKVDDVENSLGTVYAKVDGVASDLSGVASDLSGVASDLSGVDGRLKEAEEVLGEVKEVVVRPTENVVEINAVIKTGLLYTDNDGFGVYGMEIGQKNTVNGDDVFDKYARFTADRLSFYSQNDTEVAYISDYKLYITTAEILYELKIGQYKLDTTNGLAFRWEGGNS